MFTADVAGDATTETRFVPNTMSACHGPDERAARALDLLVKHLGGHAGWLFSFDGSGLSLVAPRSGGEPPSFVHERLGTEVARFFQADVPTQVLSQMAIGVAPTSGVTAGDLVTSVLWADQSGEARVVGAVAVEVSGFAGRVPRQTFLRAVAQSLFDAGDVGTRRMASK